MSKSLPDAIYIRTGEGDMAIVANKRARRFINSGFDNGGRGLWTRIAWTPDGVFASPRYRALLIDNGPGVWAMLSALHQAGLQAMFWCDDCDRLHPVEGDIADRMRMAALSGAEGVLPAHGTVQ